MKSLKLGLSIVSFVSLFCIFAAPQGLAQDDDPVPWDCYGSISDRSLTELPCYAHKQEEGLIAQHATAFPLDSGPVLQRYHSSYPDDRPSLQPCDIIAGEIQEWDALLNKRTRPEFASFRS